jgi:acetyl-CoA synthetase
VTWDYEQECASFSWALARSWLDGLPGGGLNIAHEAVDRHLGTHVEQHDALHIVHRDETVTTCTYGELAAGINRFANVLDLLDVPHDARVFSLLGRRLELYLSLLGTVKTGRVFSPLFASYGPDPIRQRLLLGDARVLVTTDALYRRKVAPIRAQLPSLEHVLLVDGDGRPDATLLAPLMAAAAAEHDTVATRDEDPALLHFTSGTTGAPKAAVHVHGAVIAHHATGRYALDLQPDDVYWCTADPGWVTGTSYGVIAPLTHGVTVVVDEEEFDAQRWWRILERERATVWYTAPTALRMLASSPGSPAHDHDLSALRLIASVGEPLHPDLVRWGEQHLGLPVHDTWWQTETGGIMLANPPGWKVRPGSMGRPLPGIEAAVVAQDADGKPVIDGGTPLLVHGTEATGVLALRAGWPSMFRGYLNDDARYRSCFAGGWYLTGDVVRRDAQGWYWFVSRGDDVIKSAGHLIGPFEVEAALAEHPAVFETAVVGRPDPTVGELVVAFVVLHQPYEPTPQLRHELVGFARKRLGAAVAPRDITFVSELPHTESGKIMRRALKDRS